MYISYLITVLRVILVKLISTTSFLLKILEHQFSSLRCSSAPILFKVLEHQFSYPENIGENSPENSIALVSFSWERAPVLFKTVDHRFPCPENSNVQSSSKQQTTSFLLLRTVVYQIPILLETVRHFKWLNKPFPYPVDNLDQHIRSPEDNASHPEHLRNSIECAASIFDSW